MRLARASDRFAAILFVHGGGYRLGSAKAYRAFASQVAARARVAAFVVDYPLAPEHRFPAAYDAVLAARRWLTAEGDQVALVGDSAGGGGLALATASDFGARGARCCVGRGLFSLGLIRR